MTVLAYDIRCTAEPLTVAHLKAVHAWPDGAGRIGGLWLDYFFESGRPVSLLGYAGLLNGNLVVVGGVFPIHNGLGEAMLIASPEVQGAKAAFVRFSRDILPELYRDMGLHRMQCIVRSDDLKARGFAKLVGFTDEYRMRRYGPDQEDCDMMVWHDE